MYVSQFVQYSKIKLKKKLEISNNNIFISKNEINVMRNVKNLGRYCGNYTAIL